MANLRKKENAQDAKDIFKVTVECSIDMTTFSQSYEVNNPETDVLTQILVYAKQNRWNINQFDTNDELMYQLEEHLTERELLEITHMDSVNEKIDDLTDELNWIAGHGIEYLTITKFGDKYELDVTKEDIRKIFLDMIQ